MPDARVTRSTREVVFHLRDGSFRSWPISARSLAAFIDLGVPEEVIGSYFGVTADEVSALANSYELH